MKRQYLRLFSFLIGITFIISGVLFTVVNNYKEEKKQQRREEQLIADEIGNVYKTFYDKEVGLSTYRDVLLNDIKEFSEFFTNMPSGYGSVISKVENYETMIMEIEDISTYLKDKCDKRYSILVANDQYDAYYKNLEKTINIFIEDMNVFNKKIKDFNDWTEIENNSVIKTRTYDKLEEYKIKKYNEYVDLNDDGTYLGKPSE